MQTSFPFFSAHTRHFRQIPEEESSAERGDATTDAHKAHKDLLKILIDRWTASRPRLHSGMCEMRESHFPFSQLTHTTFDKTLKQRQMRSRETRPQTHTKLTSSYPQDSDRSMKPLLVRVCTRAWANCANAFSLFLSSHTQILTKP